MTDQTLIDSVVEQVIKDVAQGDLTALEELLRSVPLASLQGYLSEEVLVLGCQH